MIRLLHRKRGLLASATLGLWLFALFVGIANACSWEGATGVPHHPALVAHAVADVADHHSAPGCEEFCRNDVPLQSVLKRVQDPPEGQQIVLATRHDPGFLPTSAPVFRIARTALPAPGAPSSLRLVRFRL
jgi:hypothetical protein